MGARNVRSPQNGCAILLRSEHRVSATFPRAFDPRARRPAVYPVRTGPASKDLSRVFLNADRLQDPLNGTFANAARIPTAIQKSLSARARGRRLTGAPSPTRGRTNCRSTPSGLLFIAAFLTQERAGANSAPPAGIGYFARPLISRMSALMSKPSSVSIGLRLILTGNSRPSLASAHRGRPMPIFRVSGCAANRRTISE